MRKINKRGNLDLILTGVFVFTLAGFLLVMGLIMLDDIYLDIADETASPVDETLTTVDNVTGEQVTATSNCGFHGFSVGNIANLTEGSDINSANYTVDSRTGVVKAVGTSEYADDSWVINYSYSFSNNSVCDATNKTISGQGSFADYFDLMILAVVIAVVISLLLVVFNLRRVR